MPDLEIREIEELLPTCSEFSTIDKLMHSMKMLDSITFALQQETVTIAKTRYFLDIAVAHFLELAQRLQADATIMLYVVFESEMKKIEPRGCQDLSEAETAAVDRLQTRL